MNGNFSFGDYFKEQAIAYAWELLTSPESDGGYGFDEKDLWVTVYEDDDDAIALWKKIAGLPDARIQRLGKADNYWHTGQAGPGGPLLRDLLRPRPRVWSRRGSGRRRHPIPRNLEPRLHAVPAR